MDIIPKNQLLGVEYTRDGRSNKYRIVQVFSTYVKIVNLRDDRMFTLTFKELWDKSRQKVGNFIISYELWI